MQFMQSIADKNRDDNKLRRSPVWLLPALLCVFPLLGGCVTLAGQQPSQVVQQQVKQNNASVASVPSPVDTLRILAPNKGLKTTPLFVEPLKNTDARVNRLENVVQKIKDDFDTVTPAVVRLVAIEQDIKDLVEQLGTLVDEDDARQTIIAPMREGDSILPSASMGVPAQSVKPLKLNAMSTPHVMLSDIRIEENANATRLVMSVSDKVKFDAKLQNNGKSLSIVLYNTGWDGQTHWQSDFSPLVASYDVTKQESNQIAKVKLNFVSKLIKSEILPAKAGQGYKLVLDVQSDAIHFP